MTLSTFCIAASLFLTLAGQTAAQTTADSYRNAGAAHFKAGQFRESVKAYQQVIRLKPDDAGAYHQLGEAYTRLGMNAEAATAYEKEADLLLSGHAAPPSAPAPPPARNPRNTTPPAQRQPAAASGQIKHKAGQRVEYIYNGKWMKAVITAVRDDSANQLDGKIYAPYRVHPLGYNGLTDTWVCCADFADHRSALRPAGSGPTEPVPGGEAGDEVLKGLHGAPAAPAAATGQPPAKAYHCVFFVGDHLEDVAPFTLTGGSTYTDSEGKRGNYSFASSVLTFHGGNYDGQRAEYDTEGGKPQLHILNPKGRRIIDCD